MGVFKAISVADWLRQLSRGIRRFPVAVALLLLLTGYLVYYNHVGNVPDKWQFLFLFYPATGAVLAISLQLLTEDFKSRIVALLTQFIVHVLWLGISLYLAQFDQFSLPQLAGVAATVVTMALSVFLLCFYHKGDDVAFWNFSQRTLVALVAGVVVGLVLTLGLILFLQSLEWLFGINSDDVFADVPSVCMVLLPPLLFISQIPDRDTKRDNQVPPYSGFIKGVAQYLFIPLLVLYVATLYAYGAKILFTWQLPTGWVSHLVSASMVGMVALLYLTFPVQHEPHGSFFKTVTRWMPLAMLPLLALMTVAIARRVSDYGITVSRLYLLVFNIWCYVVCIGLLWGRNKRIWWVPASFAVVLFLISVGPQSIPNVTLSQLRGEAVKAFNAAGVGELPLSGYRYGQWLQAVPTATAASIDAKLEYLERDFGRQSIADLVGDNVKPGKFNAAHGAGPREQQAGIDTAREVEAVAPMAAFSGWLFDYPLPQGYARMSLVHEQDCEASIHGDQVDIVVHKYEPTHEVYTFKTSIHQLESYGKGGREYYLEHPLFGDRAALVFDKLQVYVAGQNDARDIVLTCSGILFTR